MAYTLQAFVTRSGTFPAPLPGHLKIVRLSSGCEMIPLGLSACKAFALPFLPLTDGGQQSLPSQLAELCEKLSVQGRLAYVEAEFFGGAGTQAHVLYSMGKVVGPNVVSDSAINQALRYIGVQKGCCADEFDAIGLGRYRDTDAWLK